ncbi:MAG: zinc-binding dehydrogenase, partial [Planctomycetota bacterium]
GVQLARALGAVPIIASINDQNLEQLRTLGAAHTINGETHPEWHEEVMRLTGGRGVDHVVESGGPGTLGKSILSTRVGGSITLIGVVAQGDPPPLDMAMFKCLTLRGVSVGSVEMLESMSRAIEASGIKPVIGERFSFDDVVEAYRAFASRRRFGKVVITCDA